MFGSMCPLEVKLWKSRRTDNVNMILCKLLHRALVVSNVVLFSLCTVEFSQDLVLWQLTN